MLIRRMVLLCTAVFLVSSAAAAEEGAPGKVIFDTDISYLNDDAIAMFMLSQADKRGDLELLGVTTVGGNVYAAEATVSALRQLEMIGREDIPVYEGTDVPLAGFRDMETEARLCGKPAWCGAYWDFRLDGYSNPYARPTDYLDLGYEPDYGYPEIRAGEQTAWDFMIEQVHRYPGEVTLMAVGAATNVALAIQKDPSVVQDAAGIIYMGGDIDVPGNATAAADFNWYYDPDAVKLCLAADWKRQMVVPDDLARQVSISREVYDRLREPAMENAVAELTLRREEEFDSDPAGTNYVWDVLVPAVYLKPEIMEDLQERFLTVDAAPGLNNGRAVSWGMEQAGEAVPEGVRPAEILMSIHSDLFWDFFVELLTWQE